MKAVRFGAPLVMGLGLAWACGFDASLREYLTVSFWSPFAKTPAWIEKPDVRRIDVPYAGMAPANGISPIEKLRAAYRDVLKPEAAVEDPEPWKQAVTAARASAGLTAREREEIDLIEAKIDLRLGEMGEPQLLEASRRKLEKFLPAAKTPELASETRGWLARVHYLTGNQAAAGKIYLDELNRDGSILSRETILNSLSLTYGYDGGAKLRESIDQYFDTAEHAVFAIQLATNPSWPEPGQRPENHVQTYARIRQLLERHRDLLRTGDGARSLALLSMRTALRMGDPEFVRKTAAAVPGGAGVRREPDFQWMLASACFLSRQYLAAERPLLALFQSAAASPGQKAAAAYGLCGVYRKLHNVQAQLRYALWLRAQADKQNRLLWPATGLADLSVYWAPSGWDLNLLLEAEAPLEALFDFVQRNPKVDGARLVSYAIGVRLARENRYDEAAGVFQSIGALHRVPRMQKLAALHRESSRGDMNATYAMAEYVAANPDRIYFNDTLWAGFQRYVFQASTDSRLTRAERDLLIRQERQLKDDQEERWRAYLLLRDVVRGAGKSELGRKAAALALRCLRGISVERFERGDEVRKADLELSRWLLP